ncbi:MAG: gas vesicle protein [Thermoleophilia bacterium]|nr:gas vesicle protein [Thermoleophilia bacterium]
MKPADVAFKAKEQLCSLTGLDVDTVSALEKQEHSWRVVLELVEMRKIPESSNMLGTYEAILNDQGGLLSYRRTRRYQRGDGMDER